MYPVDEHQGGSAHDSTIEGRAAQCGDAADRQRRSVRVDAFQNVQKVRIGGSACLPGG